MQKSPTECVREWSHAQISAARIAEYESLTVARLTMLRRLRIGALRRKRLMAIGNLTWRCSVDPVMQQRAVEMYLKNRASIKPKEQWDRLSENSQPGQRNITS